MEGLLIVVFSVLLVPVGLSRLGGFAGLHAAVPAHMFELFGSATLSDYGWYTVVGMVFAIAAGGLITAIHGVADQPRHPVLECAAARCGLSGDGPHLDAARAQRDEVLLRRRDRRGRRW